MNDNDLRFETAVVFYECYLKTIEVATVEQSRLADRFYYYLHELQPTCDLYKNYEIEKPENHIKHVTEE